MTAAAALARLAEACADPRAVAAEMRAVGRRVVWMLGSDLPYALVDAAGFHPIRLVPDARVDRSAIDAMVSAETLGERGRSLLAEIIALPVDDALLISHADAEQPQIFATLRELARTGAIPRPEVHFLDLLTIDRPSTERYNRIRVEQAIAWLAGLGGAGDLAAAIERREAQRDALASVLDLRAERRLTGVEAHHLVAAASILPPDDFAALLAELDAGKVELPVHTGVRVLLSGSDIEDVAVIERIEALGALIVGEDHGWGAARARRAFSRSGDPISALARSSLTPSWGVFSGIADRAMVLGAAVGRLAPERVLHFNRNGDDSAPWEVAALRRTIRESGVPMLDTAPDSRALPGFIARGDMPVTERETVGGSDEAAPSPRARAPRSRKSLAAVARFGAYQRDWFAEVRAAALSGATFAAVNANSPQEMLRAIGIPFVVNQWWASIVAAKQQSTRYAALLAANDLPPAVEAYSAQGVAAAFDDDPDLAPWGGLPRPDILGMVTSTDATTHLFEAWQAATGARLQQFQRSVESRWDIPIDWWDGLADRWDEFIEPERLDLFEAELRLAIAELEQVSGRSFDPARLEEVMTLVNEQEDHYRETRDLIARTVPVPVGIVDTMPATMVPQWHRGTEWARDAARDFHDEVAARVRAGEAACPNERIRLMFVGRGLWSDMQFYQRWEESHGAVFVCSMYLSLAADGYIRRHDRGRDPLRALAARFVTMGDELRMPTWAGAWHVKEALLNQCDGAVALSDADPLVLRALRDAGVAVLELGMDNFSRDEAGEADVDVRVVAFLEGPAGAASATRRMAQR
jgi:benzoyl-CoA reductase/2-hydroxyglutaryl-CoA dehydratase subunit BcrC/BadD/HgdB